uniref:Uncharacterized protein n=1 Tax=Rhizophora mucronata TaxID=61149 RepID=A0A2P2IVS5_RHIMU
MNFRDCFSVASQNQSFHSIKSTITCSLRFPTRSSFILFGNLQLDINKGNECLYFIYNSVNYSMRIFVV